MIKIEHYGCITGLYKEVYYKPNNPNYKEVLKIIEKEKDKYDKLGIVITGGVYVTIGENDSFHLNMLELDETKADLVWRTFNKCTGKYYGDK